MASDVDTVLLHEDSVSFVEQHTTLLTDVLLCKFGCVATFHGMGPGQSKKPNIDPEQRSSVPGQSKKPNIDPELRFSVLLPKGLTVSVCKADLTTFKVDAVVNAANVNLMHFGGLALALSQAGGPDIQSESTNYTLQNGPLKKGDAITTTAGLLPCKKIIHAVGPDLRPYPNQYMVSTAEPYLKKAVLSIIEQLKIHKLQSVAIPALSSGLFNFPLQRCAEVLVTTLQEYHDQIYTGRLPLEIKLVNNDEPSVTAMTKACQQILRGTQPSRPHSSHSSYSQAAGSHVTSAAKTSASTVQIGNIFLTLEKGKIEEQKTDVIVNTTSQSLTLSEGQISGAIAMKAGVNMQGELSRCLSIGQCAQPGMVFQTRPYQLQCKSVFHTVCARRGELSAVKILRQTIGNCLELAVNAKHQSIAFPAIGTGNLGFDKKEVAQIMTDTVREFAPFCTTTMDVHFVIYPSDDDTWKAFEHQLRSCRDGENQPSSSQGFEPKKTLADRRTSTPQIKLNAHVDEMAHEAKLWLDRLLYPSGTIIAQNNFIQHFGRQEFQRFDDKAKPGVSIEVFFNKGSAGIMIRGESAGDVAAVGLEAEAMLCAAQKEFVAEEAQTMQLSTSLRVTDNMKLVDSGSSEFLDKGRLFADQKLRMIKLIKLENPALKALFELKKKQLNSPVTTQMYQRIPAQFCSLVRHTGFQREYAPPDDPKFGEGIYFTGGVGEAMKVWKDLANDDKYVYLVEAQVLAGRDTYGSQGLIVPPSTAGDPLTLYDSVRGGTDTHVIFNGYQALPEYIIICNQNKKF